ncbi:hypothetical protein WA158_002317 [Blastocystis sp. Blastoise]
MGKNDIVSAELFALTYGAFIAQIIDDYENMDDVNRQLDEIGYNIGNRLVEEFLAKTKTRNCKDFKTTCNVIATKAFPMFLGVSAEVVGSNEEGDVFHIVFHENPLTLFVELPDEYKDLNYSALICGVIKGALEMLHMRVECSFVQDMIKGDSNYDIRVKLVQVVEENARSMYRDE